MNLLLEPKKFLLFEKAEFPREGKPDFEGRWIGIKKFDDPPEFMIDASNNCVPIFTPKQARWLVAEIEDWLSKIGRE